MFETRLRLALDYWDLAQFFFEATQLRLSCEWHHQLTLGPETWYLQ